MRLLRVDSSARGSSVTRKLTGKFTEIWKKEHPDGEVLEHDLSTLSLPNITDDWSATAVRDGGHIPESEVRKLQEAGYSDEEIVEIIAFVALSIFRSCFNLIVGTEVDFPPVRSNRSTAQQ